MKLRRRIGSVFLAFAMALSLIPSVAVSALAADSISNEYIKFEYDYGAAALRNNEITVIVQDENGQKLGESVVVNDFYTGVAAHVTITSLKDEYEIYSVEETDGNVSITLPDNQKNVFSCNVYGKGTITVTLGEPFEDPDIQGDKIDRVSINYEAYIPALLKLLHVNGVENVDKNTEIDGVSIHFVEEYAYSADWEFELMPSGADNLAYYYPKGGALSTAGGNNTPYNIRYLEITYTQDGGEKQTCRVESKDLRYVNVGGNTYEIEANNDNEYIVAFYWERPGDQMVWQLYDVSFVNANQALGNDKLPPNPTYEPTDYTFTNWSTDTGGDHPFLAYEPVTDDQVVYAQRISSDWTGTQYRVRNDNDELLNRLLELYNAEKGTEITYVDPDSIKIQVNGENQNHNAYTHTNPDYWDNGWEDDNAYYWVNNALIAGDHPTISNPHVPADNADSITIFATINSEDYSVTIPIDNTIPGGMNLVHDGNNEDITWIQVNKPPEAPSEEEIIGTPPDGLLGENAVTVDCVNTEIDPEHGDATYGLLEDSFTPPTENDIQWAAGEGEDDFGYYYIDLEVSSEAYITEYNEKVASGHSLNMDEQATQTIRLICKEFDDTTGKWVWEVETTTPITFQVICETPESGYAISGIDKTLVDTDEEKSAAQEAGVELSNYTFPDENSLVVIPNDGNVTLLYAITVTGEEGASFTVADQGATLVTVSNVSVTQSGNDFSGTISDTGSITFYVSKTFDADDIVDGKLTNTAELTGENAPEEGGEDTEEVDAAEAYPIYVYVQFVGQDQSLTEDEKTTVSETYGGDLKNDGYMAIGYFEAPMPDPTDTDADYAPNPDGSAGGKDVLTDYWDEIKPYLTKDNFTWNTTVNSEAFDLEDGIKWIKLSVAHSATDFTPPEDGKCWHLDGQIQLYAPDIDVTKALTKINDTEYTAGTDAMVEVGDTLTWTITVTNSGNAKATDLTLTDTLTANGQARELTSLTKDGDDTWTAGSTFDVATEGEDGSTVTFTATYEVTAEDKGLTLSNTAKVEGDGQGEDDETETPVEIEVEDPAVTITKTAAVDGTTINTGDKVDVGDTITYTITVENTGNVDLTNVPIEDSLWVTPYVEHVNVTSEGHSISNGVITIDNIAEDASVTITYTYEVQDTDAGGTIKNTANVVNDEDGDDDDDIDDGGGDEFEVEVKDDGGDTPTPPVEDDDDDTPPPVNPNPPQLNTEDHYAYIVGYEDGTVRPEGEITRAEVATIFFRLLTDESRNEYWSQTNDYTDVAEGDWYNNAVSTLSKAGILNGYEDGSFQPNGNITRAEFATIAARFFEATYEGEDLFPDIAGHWARDYINQAAHAGIVNGYEDGTFRPQENITRAEAMTIVNRTLDRHPDADHFLDNMKTWPDNLESAWYYEQVQEATNSHEYIMKTDADKNPYEIWKEILPVRDWSDLENTWSEAHAG